VTPPTFDRRTIERAWAWHSWSPGWLTPRMAGRARRLGLFAFTEAGICTLATGRRMLLRLDDLVQCTMAHAGEWEGPIFAAVRDRVKPGDVVLDVGGHVGYSALLFADWVGPSGRVIVFEPLPAHAERIEANAALNAFDGRVEIVRAAVSDRDGVVEFQPSSFLNTGMGAIAPGKGKLRVPTIALDDWLDERNVDRVGLLKLDIEGAEILALRGLERTLRDKRIETLLMEIHPDQLPSFGSSVPETLSLLSHAGYRTSFWNEQRGFVEESTAADCFHVLAFA
jgi:FkbM family methyltransferase